MLSALIAFHSNPEGHSWAKSSAVSFLSCAPIVASGSFRWKQLVPGLTFGAIE